MREAPRMSSASRMYEGGPSSPACATARRPSERARAKTAEIFERQRFFECLHCRLGAEMPKETENEARRDRAFAHRGADSVDDSLECDAATGVRLWIEEDFCVTDVVGGSAPQIGHRHVVEVALLAQDGGALVVDVEKRLQIGELIRAAQRVDRWISKPLAVSLRDLEHQLRLERSLDVNVQLGLRNPSNQIFQRHQCGNPKM